MREYCLAGYLEMSSPHYRYFCRPDSIAAKEIDHIMQVQEESYARIVRLLEVEPDFPMRYILCDTSEEVGKIYGDNEPCNGFADTPDTVFAVYNEDVKCIGPHEDTHLIAELIARPASNFVREGLAMYMDESWWGRPNADWVAEFIRDGKYISIGRLFVNRIFFDHSEDLTYPIAGAFTLWLIEQMGMEGYLRLVYVQGDQSLDAIEKYFGLSIDEADAAFQKWIIERR